MDLLAPQLVVLYVLVLSAVAVHVRGNVRFRFARQLTDHSTFTAPYNLFVYLFSAVPNRPMLDVGQFPELAPLQEHWATIRDEARSLCDTGHIRQSEQPDDVYGNSFFKRGWRRFYFKWYGDFLPSARRLCPQTVALLEDIPAVHSAMFSLVPARGRLGKHRDPFAASLRYHLGLITPNSDACRIYVDGHPYAWRDGQAVLFDETYVHWVENETDEPRIVLFCDVERPLRGSIPMAINRFVIHRLLRVTAPRNLPDERLGAVNRIFARTYPFYLSARRLKETSATLYYSLKFGLILVAVVLILLAARG